MCIINASVPVPGIAILFYSMFHIPYEFSVKTFGRGIRRIGILFTKLFRGYMASAFCGFIPAGYLKGRGNVTFSGTPLSVANSRKNIRTFCMGPGCP